MSQAAALLRVATGQLRAAGIPDPAREARLLMGHVLNVAPASLIVDGSQTVDPRQEEAFLGVIARRAGREPVSHILGQREFWSLAFDVGPDVLDPRPDSETLVRAVLDRIPDRNSPLALLDLGTGSGCLLLALLHELPRARGLGIDRSPAALGVAERNAKRLGLEARSEFRSGDWLDGVQQCFDIIVSNPPYIESGIIPSLEPEVRNFEPHGALDGGPDGLDCYRAIAARLRMALHPGALAAFEFGAGQAPAVAGIMVADGLEILSTEKDLAGHERCLLLRSPKP